MADYTELINKLRELNCNGTCESDDCIIVQATNAIKALQTEVVEKDKHIADLKYEVEQSHREVSVLSRHLRKWLEDEERKENRQMDACDECAVTEDN